MKLNEPRQNEINKWPKFNLRKPRVELVVEEKESGYKWADVDHRKYWMIIPKANGSGLEYHKLPKDVYEHKIYPTCMTCSERFVIMNENDKECFKCQFTRS